MPTPIEVLVKTTVATLGLALGVCARADDSLNPVDPALEEAERRSSEIRMRIEDGETDASVDRVSQPVLRFEDPTRANDQGTFWIWGAAGRPVAVLELYWLFFDSSQN